jgi:hypothetical protein
VLDGIVRGRHLALVCWTFTGKDLDAIRRQQLSWGEGKWLRLMLDWGIRARLIRKSLPT